MSYTREKSRFHCPSDVLSLGNLLKRTRKTFWMGFVLALAVHLLLTQIKVFEGEEAIIRPLTMRFIKREPIPYDHDGFDRFEFVRGITLDGRLVAMIETGDYEQCIRTDWNNIDGTRYEQFLVNSVIFALIQEGSITQQIMDIVNY